MELRWLHDFLAVSETKSFTRAADLRHASQAALSRRIQQLEAWLGVRLIDRAVYPSCLTAEGERFVAQANEILRLAQESREEATKGSRSSFDLLRVTLPLAIASSSLPMWWRQWTTGTRAPSCEVIPTNLHDAVTALVSDSADLLLCFDSPILPIQLDPSRFERCVLFGDLLRPYAKPALLRQESSAIVAAQEDRLGLLLYADGTYLGQLVKKIFEAGQWPAGSKPSMRSDMADVLRQMAIDGHGVAWLPGCTAAPAVARGELAPIGDPKWAMNLRYVAYRNRENHNPALHRVWQRILETGIENNVPSWG